MGNDGKFNTLDDVVIFNDIKVPVGVPIIMELVVVDVIYFLYLFNLCVK